MASNRFLEMFSHHSSDDTSSVISYTDSSDDKEKPVWKKRKINNGGVDAKTRFAAVKAKIDEFDAEDKKATAKHVTGIKKVEDEKLKAEVALENAKMKITAHETLGAEVAFENVKKQVAEHEQRGGGQKQAAFGDIKKQVAEHDTKTDKLSREKRKAKWAIKRAERRIFGLGNVHEKDEEARANAALVAIHARVL